ncbi:MAG: Rieske (2Fe-2S) protein [Pseudomonadota bacterium]
MSSEQMATDWHDALAADALADGERRCVEVAGVRILIVEADGCIHALSPECTHAGAALADGRVRGGDIICSRHGMRFGLADGEPKGPLSRTPLTVYPCREREGRIEVAL